MFRDSIGLARAANAAPYNWVPLSRPRALARSGSQLRARPLPTRSLSRSRFETPQGLSFEAVRNAHLQMFGQVPHVNGRACSWSTAQDYHLSIVSFRGLSEVHGALASGKTNIHDSRMLIHINYFPSGVWIFPPSRGRLRFRVTQGRRPLRWAASAKGADEDRWTCRGTVAMHGYTGGGGGTQGHSIDVKRRHVTGSMGP